MASAAPNRTQSKAHPIVEVINISCFVLGLWIVFATFLSLVAFLHSFRTVVSNNPRFLLASATKDPMKEILKPRVCCNKIIQLPHSNRSEV